MLANFKQQIITTTQAKINTFIGGEGYPLLLLHGYPQNYYMWHKIYDRLSQEFTIIITDLRGYGNSEKLPVTPDSRNYSKRVMAKDQVEVMSSLGYDRFYLVGHDRGARVAHRLTLDHPQRVQKLALLDIVPTYQLYTTTDREFATAYYHWFFLIQPHPFPENLINSNPEYFLRYCLQSWSRVKGAFTEKAFKEYLRCFSNPETVNSTCEDYRASAGIDLIHDREDLDKKITCPLLVLWGARGIIGKKYDVIASWQERAINVTGKEINCGHFLAEEAPEKTYLALQEFLIK
ncbi:Haloacetate dehalogenase H-1 [Hyella patelloides LEGE 07179]|uniref:Haloacetate dehalogenase H-1 n=1 Tax=Hyella patelloides LEGE 07179 TaxID=945734 RepID=A0A563VQH5_9CYAN|nr:alpha/beta hydrolase [Hyella patelloides]VEP13716.1 Haloacetate dehalogenase H-1 [Hyella patelloides LEGE 07179]